LVPEIPGSLEQARSLKTAESSTFEKIITKRYKLFLHLTKALWGIKGPKRTPAIFLSVVSCQISLHYALTKLVETGSWLICSALIYRHFGNSAVSFSAGPACARRLRRGLAL
jgi:hypothetical protein